MNIKRSSKVIMALLLAASALFTTELMAQDLKKPTLEDLLSGGETYRIKPAEFTVVGRRMHKARHRLIVCRQPQNRKRDTAHNAGKG